MVAGKIRCVMGEGLHSAGPGNKLLFRVLAALATARDEVAVCRVLAAGLAQAVACDRGPAVCLAGSDGEVRAVARAAGDEGGVDRYGPAGSLVRQVIRSRVPYLGPAEGVDFWPLAEGASQLLVVPVRGRTGTRAAAIMGRTAGWPFSLAEIETCLLLAEQAGLAMDNVRLISRLRQTARRLGEQRKQLREMTVGRREGSPCGRRSGQPDAGRILPVHGRELRVVYRVAQETRALLDLDVLLQRILNILHESLGPGYQYIVLLPDEATGELVVRAVAGYPQEVVGFRVPGGKGVTGWAFRTGQVQVVDDCSQDPRYISVPTGANASEVAIPLVAQDQVIGVLDVGGDTVAAFSEEDLQLLVAVAGHVADYIFVALQHRYTAQAAVTDGLTGVYNYAYLYARLRDEIARCCRTGAPLSVAFLDFDHLKRVNDRYGHLAGNAVVRAVAESLKAGVRAADVVGRYGGDEFVIIMPDTGRRDAEQAVRRVLGGVPAEVYVREVAVPVPGISWGVAAHPEDGDTPDDLLVAADTRMYRTKGIEIEG